MATYIVIGGTKGIGREITDQLSRDGSQVIVMARNNPGDLPSGVKFIHWDAESGEFPENVADSVDGLVYCPGTINLKPFGRLRNEDFTSDWNINVMGAVHAVQGLEKALKKGNNPSVVFFSTVAVQNGMPYHASVAAAKGAIEGLTRSLAAEYSPVVRFNCIAPSITDTPLAGRILSNDDRKQASADRHPMKRVGNASDIADMSMFLLGDKSTWITGQVIHVDGGMSAIGS